jgi:hypothetical protein
MTVDPPASYVNVHSRADESVRGSIDMTIENLVDNGGL